MVSPTTVQSLKISFSFSTSAGSTVTTDISGISLSPSSFQPLGKLLARLVSVMTPAVVSTGTALIPSSCHEPSCSPFIRFTTSVPSLLLKYVVPQSPQVVAVIVRLLSLLLHQCSAEPVEVLTQKNILPAVKLPFSLALYTRWNVQLPSPPHPMMLPA